MHIMMIEILCNFYTCYCNERCRRSSISTTQFVDLHIAQMLMSVLILPISLHCLRKVTELATYM